MGRYLAIPGVILLILLVTLGARAESSDEFSERQAQESRDKSSNGSDSGRDEPDQNDGDSPDREPIETRFRYEEGTDEGDKPIGSCTRISIGTENGRIAIEPAGTEENTGVTWDIDDPLPADLIGFREAGGEYQPVREGRQQPGDVLISWDDDRLILTEVGGGTTEIRRSDEGLTGSFTDVDGTITEFEPNGRDPVLVNPSLQAEPEDPGPIYGYDPSDPFEPPFGAGWPWSLIGLITALTMFTLGMWLIFKDGIGLRAVSYDVPERDRPASRVATLEEELSLFDRLRRSQDADAVVRELYERATSGEWRIDRRLPDQTPLEFFNQVRVTMPSQAATELGRLSDLYSAVKFAPGEATLEHRDRAIEIAERLLEQMQLSEALVSA